LPFLSRRYRLDIQFCVRSWEEDEHKVQKQIRFAIYIIRCRLLGLSGFLLANREFGA
jgi:hypothetical protein